MNHAKSLIVATHPRLYTSTFLVLCLSYAFFGASFNMIIPELPAYLTSLGGSDYKGLIIALFTLTAGLSRPFSGKLADLIGRKPIIVVGTLVCIVCSLSYPLLASVSGFLFLRLIHGFSTGFSPTAVTAYVADIVPTHRRGEAMGIIGVSINVGSSISPPVGSYLAGEYSLDAMFIASASLSMVSLLLLIGLKETVEGAQRFDSSFLRLKKSEIVNRSSVFPALVCGLAYMGFGAILTVTPDQAVHFGLSNKGLFFTTFTFCSILSRLVAGTVSDSYGRLPVMRFAIGLLAISYVIFGMSDGKIWLLAGSGFVGFALGIVVPTVFAWTVDRSTDLNRGRAIATLFIGLEFAIGIGALLGAALYDNHHEYFLRTFLVMAFISLFALLFIREDPFQKRRGHKRMDIQY